VQNAVPKERMHDKSGANSQMRNSTPNYNQPPILANGQQRDYHTNASNFNPSMPPNAYPRWFHSIGLNQPSPSVIPDQLMMNYDMICIIIVQICL
jgi:hypothetical protein